MKNELDRYENHFDAEELLLFADVSFEGISITENGIFIGMNEQYLKMHQYRREDLVGQPVLSIIAPRSRQIVADAIRSDDPGPYRHYALRKDGTEILLEVRARTLNVRNRKIRLAVVRDITDYERTREDLRRAEERLRLFASATFEGLSMIENGIIIDANEHLLSMVGYRREKLIGKPALTIVPPHSQAPVAEAIRLNRTEPYEHFLRRKDGTEFPCETRAHILSANGRTIRLAAVRDITERKRAEEALRASEERYRSLFEHNDLVILLIDPTSGNIVETNSAACAYYGYTKEEITHLKISDINTLTPEQIFAEMREARERNKNVFYFRHRLANGEERDVEVHSGPIVLHERELLYSIVKDLTVQRQMEKALRDGERRLRQVIDLVPHSIYAKDADGRYVLANRATAGVWGTTPEEMIGKTVSDFAKTEEEIRQSRSADLQVMEKGVALSVPDHLIDVHGNLRHFLSTKIPFLFSENAPPGVLGVSVDVTEQRKKEELLRASEERARMLVDATSEGICITENAYFVDVNERYASMTGYRREELIGMSVLTIVPPRSRARMLRAVQFDDTEPYEHFLTRKDGREVLFEVRPQIFYSEGRKLRLTAVRDITEQRRAEKSLQESEERYRILANATFEGIIVSENGRFVDVNDEFLSMIGYQREDLIGKPLTLTIAPRSHAAVASAIQSDRTEAYEHFALRKDGTELLVEARARIFYSDGRKLRMAAIRDITERKKAEEALRQAQKMESLGVLAGGIAHDFNNLLQAISGQIYITLNKLPESFGGRDNLEKAQFAANRAADLTRQLLAYSGRGRFVIEVIELNAFVRDSLHLLQIAVPKNVDVLFELADLPLHFRADVAQTQQVLLNLVINGAEAMNGNAGTMVVRTRRQTITEEDRSSWKCGNISPGPGPFVVLEVEDTGQGMDQSTIERIFDPFFTTKFTGRGLGLSAVLGIIRGHEGGLQVESAVDVGTRFRVAFPQVASSSVVPHDSVPAPATAREPRGTILFIDDEAPVRQAFLDALDGSNVTVITAKDGEEGIALFRQHEREISLVLLDLSMPGMGGEATLRELRGINPHVRVVLSSGYAEEEIMGKFKDVEVAGFIPKPYPWDRLNQLLSEYLRA